MAHADGLRQLEYFNTRSSEKDQWSYLASLPELCGIDGAAIAGHRTKVFFMVFKVLKLKGPTPFFGLRRMRVHLMRIEMVFSILLVK